MKERLREKLLETRNEFEEIKGKYKCKRFFLEVDLSFDDENNVVIIMRSVATKEDDINICFGKQEVIETKNEDMSVFIDLLKYAEKRYENQFVYVIHPIIYCFFGNGMNTKKLEYVLTQFKDNKDYIKEKIGFAISETIF